MAFRKIASEAILCLLGILATAILASAQVGSNPFELTPRLSSKPDTATHARPYVATGNPFDIVVPPSTPPGKGSRSVTTETPRPQLNQPAAQKPQKLVKPHGSFLFVVILLMLMLLALMLTLLRSEIVKIYQAFLNDNLLNQLHREQTAMIAIPYQLLYVMFFVNGGVYLYLLLYHLKVSVFESQWLNFGLCIAAVTSALTFKHVVLLFLGWLFPIDKELSVYRFTIIIFNIILAIVLVPFNVVLAFGPEELVKLAIFSSLGVLVLVFAFRHMRGLFIARRFVLTQQLHFLLYLCTVEISPLLVIVKAAQLWSA